MQSSFKPTFGFTIGVETDRVSVVRADGGNWTGGEPNVGTLIGSKYGVSAPQLSDWLGRTATAEDMRSLSEDDAQAIFGAGFWNRANGDGLPAGPDLMTVDHSYNRGCSQGPRVLQRLVGQTADGWIGPATLAAVGAFTAAAVPLSVVDAKALQEGVGVAQDGNVGPVTRAALAALPAGDALMVALYAAQVRDYRGLAAAPRNPGWFTRARDRLAAARKLGAAA